MESSITKEEDTENKRLFYVVSAFYFELQRDMVSASENKKLILDNKEEWKKDIGERQTEIKINPKMQ